MCATDENRFCDFSSVVNLLRLCVWLLCTRYCKSVIGYDCTINYNHSTLYAYYIKEKNLYEYIITAKENEGRINKDYSVHMRKSEGENVERERETR